MKTSEFKNDPALKPEKKTGMIVGSGSLFLEKKFLRDRGTCGHIEDIVVDKT